MIDVVSYVAICATIVDTFITDYGEKVIAFVFRVFVEYYLHFFCPFYHQLLSCLASAVCDVAVCKVGLAQICHVYETHPTEHEAHDEHVTGKVKLRNEGKVKSFDLFDGLKRKSSLHCLIYSGIYVSKGISISDYVFFYSAVIYCPKDSGVERDCVRRHSSLMMPQRKK